MTELRDLDLPAGLKPHCARRGGRWFAAAVAVLIGLTVTDARASTDRRIPVPSPAGEPSFLIAQVIPGSSVAVRSAPAGPVVTRLGSWTEFGSPRALSVVSHRGHWIGVTTPELGNGRLGWIDARGRAIDYSRTTFRIEVDLSRRELRLHHGDRVARRLAVSIGRPGSPTPIGRFAITDKFPDARRYSPVYGCCILALSGRQTHLPPGWTGGDRLAIHGSPGDGVGGAESAGCLHARERDLHLLMRMVPLGTPVVIHP